MINLFVCGLSGSGKDTIANYFKDTHLYLKFRCAGTIKQIICEKSQLSFSHMETAKRSDESLRKDHWKVGDWMGKDGASVKQRILNIISHDSVEYDIIPKSLVNNGIIFCDVRRLFEAETMLQNGFVGIFLSRTTEEYKPGKHSTEQNMFTNGELKYLVDKYPKQCVVVFNQRSTINDEQIHHIQTELTQALNIVVAPNENNGDALVKIFSENLESIIPMFYKNKSSEILFQ